MSLRSRLHAFLFAVSLLFAGALFLPAARAGSATFALSAADSAPQYYQYESGSESASVRFTLHGATSNVGLTAGAAKTIHVGAGEFGDYDTTQNINYDGKPLPHAMSLTGAGGTVTQVLPQIDNLDVTNNQTVSVDIHAGPTVTFDMGTQGRIDVTPQEYTYIYLYDTGNANAPKFAYMLLLRSAAVPVSGLTITPASVTYPASTTGTITLARPAPDAQNVTLTSSNPAVAAVPVSVPVAAGQQTVTFPVTTYRVDSDTAITVSAGAGGTTKNTSLTVKTRPETAFTYTFADVPQITYVGQDSNLYFGLTGGSGTVKLAQNVPYTLTVGQYSYNYDVDNSADQTVGPLSLSRGCTLNGAAQSFSQTLNMSLSYSDDPGDRYFSASVSDSQTLLYDFGTQGRIQVTASGFSYNYNNITYPAFVSTAPVQYTFLLMPPASSALYYVSPSGDDANPGTQAAPFQTIQHAINGATSGDTIVLEDGTYSGTGNVSIDFGGKSVVLTSQNGAGKAFIDGGGTQRLFLFSKGEMAAVVSNITLQKGSGYVGGAAYITGGSVVTFSGCQFTGNHAYYGGGIYNDGTVTLNQCTFTGNVATYYGGGVASDNGSTTFTNCALTGNAASLYGGGVASNGNTTLRFCTFAANAVTGTVQNYAQSVAVEDASASTTATDCIFYGDTGPGNAEIDMDGPVTHCDVQGGYDGDGNFDADPRFVRNPNPAATPPDYGDRHLQSTSPCIGQGIALADVTTDRDGKPRANPPSVGAYDYHALPVLNSLSPATATAGGPAFILSVNGTGFAATSIIKWNSTSLTTTSVSSTKLTANVSASLIASAGTASVTVTTPQVATSGSKTFTIKAATITVASLVLSPASVKGGAATSTGTITLSGPAPSGGLAVTQKSSNTSAATLAGTLNIPAGETSAKFKVTTYAVSNTKSVTITSSANGTSKTATLTVTH